MDNNGNFNPNEYQPNPYGNQQDQYVQPNQYAQPNLYDQQAYSNQQYNGYQQTYDQYGPVSGFVNGPKDNNGQTLGVVSIILALFFPLISLILGIVGLKKSKQNRNNNTPKILNWIGIFASSLILILSLFLTVYVVKHIMTTGHYSYSHSYNYTNHNDKDADEDEEEDDDVDDEDELDPFDEEGDLEHEDDVENSQEFANDLNQLDTNNNETVAETNNDTSVYSENFSDSTESYSGTYTPSYETVSHGDDVQGYIEVPSTYFDFYETDGYSDKLLAHQQYAYGMLDIITHYTFPGEDVPDLEAFAAGYQISFSTTAEKCDVYNATFGDNQGYLVYAEYSDGAILRAFIFEDNKGNVQYLCVEGVNDEYSDVYKTVFCNYVQP